MPCIIIENRQNQWGQSYQIALIPHVFELGYLQVLNALFTDMSYVIIHSTKERKILVNYKIFCRSDQNLALKLNKCLLSIRGISYIVCVVCLSEQLTTVSKWNKLAGGRTRFEITLIPSILSQIIIAPSTFSMKLRILSPSRCLVNKYRANCT